MLMMAVIMMMMMMMMMITLRPKEPTQINYADFNFSADTKCFFSHPLTALLYIIFASLSNFLLYLNVHFG